MVKKLTDNEKKLSDRLKGINLKPVATEQSIKDLIVEGDKLLKEDETTVIPKTITKTITKISNSNNPYLRAKIKILADMASNFRCEILELEKTNNLDHRFYNEFVEKVADLGDQYSNEPKT